VRSTDASLSVETADPEQNTSKGSGHTLSLFPVYLPFQSCFNFGQRELLDVMQNHNWDCPESAELNTWAAEFQKRPEIFATRKGDTSKPLSVLFSSIAAIRHTAVHRLGISAKTVEEFIIDAESLADLLGSEAQLKSLIKLRQDTQKMIEELERNKNLLSSKLTDTLETIAAQRAELDRLEEAAIAEMIKEDSQYQAFAGIKLDQAIASSDENDLTVILTKPESNFDGGYIESFEDFGESSWVLA
jgi:hypothetical protein